MLVRNPWAPDIRTLFSITSRMALSTSPFCSSSCFSAASAAPSSGPTPRIARSSAWCTKPAVTCGASSVTLGASVPAQARGDAHACSLQTGPCHDVCVPVEPPPSPWAFPPADSGDGDLVAIGADLSPGTLLAAYRGGLFPMAVDGTDDGDGLVVTRGARRAAALGAAGDHGRCASPRAGSRSGWTPPSTRSSPRVRTRGARAAGSTSDIVSAYTELHRLGWAHSVEAWRDDELAGGLYGVAIGGLFAGESMFTRARDASKVALMGLVDLLSDEYADRAAPRHPVADPAPRDARGRGGAAAGVPATARAGAAAPAAERLARGSAA